MTTFLHQGQIFNKIELVETIEWLCITKMFDKEIELYVQSIYFDDLNFIYKRFDLFDN